MKRILTDSLLATLRAIAVLFLAVPGAGVALVAVACSGDDVADRSAAKQVVDASPLHQDAAASHEAPAPRLTLPVIEAVPEPAARPQPAVAHAPAAPALEPVVTAPAADIATVADLAVIPRRPKLARSDGPLAIVDTALGIDVEDRMPVGVATHFGQDVGKVWAWARVKNAGEPTQIQMVWKREGVVKSRLTLDVGTSSGWRTWSRKTMRTKDVGRWTVEITGPDGEMLDVMTFDISAGETASTDGELGC